MLSPEEKRFFAGIAIGARNLSKCEKPGGAVLVGGGRILSYGYNKSVIDGQPWEVSAIYDALFSVRDLDVSDTTLFCTYFPNLNDLTLILASGISTIYFFGKIDDQESVKLMNESKRCSIPLEIVQLEG